MISRDIQREILAWWNGCGFLEILFRFCCCHCSRCNASSAEKWFRRRGSLFTSRLTAASSLTCATCAAAPSFSRSISLPRKKKENTSLFFETGKKRNQPSQRIRDRVMRQPVDIDRPTWTRTSASTTGVWTDRSGSCAPSAATPATRSTSWRCTNASTPTSGLSNVSSATRSSAKKCVVHFVFVCFSWSTQRVIDPSGFLHTAIMKHYYFAVFLSIGDVDAAHQDAHGRETLRVQHLRHRLRRSRHLRPALQAQARAAIRRRPRRTSSTRSVRARYRTVSLSIAWFELSGSFRVDRLFFPFLGTPHGRARCSRSGQWLL